MSCQTTGLADQESRSPGDVQRPWQHKYIGRPEHDQNTPELQQSRVLQGQVLQKFLHAAAQHAFFTNAHHVNKVHIFYVSLFNAMLETHPTTGPRQALCTNLVSLELAREIKPPIMHFNSSITLNLVTEHMSNLQELHLSGGVGQYALKVMLKHLPESIHKVHLFFSRHLPQTVDPALLQRLDTGSRRQPCHHHALEFLRLDGTVEDDAGGILLPFLYTCTRRLTLRVSPFKIKCFRRQAMRAAWLQVGSTLKSLHHIPTSLDSCIFSSTEDRDIAWTIRWGQNWRTLTLNGHQTASLTASAILDHCDHLQEIVLVGCDRITSIGLPEWACRRLQKFICEIQVPRSDDQAHSSVVEGFSGTVLRSSIAWIFSDKCFYS
ncbi:MAG: hypothetical protein BYD32DRAFT_456552 [Podila humilis]|nr:MAG: hypothetical protein BYD32DRAFT_456552 [Podila humilis]